jgi:23S rRNA (cytosine1962-C5)-methyltransferase
LYPGEISIFDKSAESMTGETGVSNHLLAGEKTETEILENGIPLYVNVAEGQKTGFFLDQRENRLLLGSYAAGKKVLNTFAYSGGFSMYALENKAELVHSVDSSMKAAAWAEKNAELNAVKEGHEFFTEDVMPFFKDAKQAYNLMVLDPPAFAKSRSPEAIKRATVGYRNLNTEALKRIAPGGIIFTFSCSQPIDKELFRKIIFSAAAQAKRPVRILHQLTQPPDHPINLFHPEGEYLKGLVLFVE